MRAAHALLLLGALLVPHPAGAGEALPPGPPWKQAWPDARRGGLRQGRPLFLYFTKSH